MSDVLIDQNTMEDIGDSIRSKLGVQTTYLPSEMPSAIMSISGGGGGGSAKYSETVLWSGTQAGLGSIQLSESVNNFDQILILWNANTNSDAYAKYSYLIAVSDIDYTRTYQYQLICTLVNASYSSYASLHFSDSTHLTIDEYSNGSNSNLRILKVIGVKWETMQTALIYSEEEREVGVWTDGKPLYQKTVHFGALRQGANNIPHGVSNIEHVTYFEGTTKNPTTGITISIPYTNPRMNPYEDGTNIVIWVEAALSAYTDGRATFRYTKTTDTPGSGIWTTTGEYAHHYSTTEHVIGTWIDGKTLYEKTVSFTSGATNTYLNYLTDVENPDTIMIDFSASYFVYSATSKIGIMPYQGSANMDAMTVRMYPTIVNNKIRLDYRVGTDAANKLIVVTIRYTKTT